MQYWNNVLVVINQPDWNFNIIFKIILVKSAIKGQSLMLQRNLQTFGYDHVAEKKIILWIRLEKTRTHTHTFAIRHPQLKMYIRFKSIWAMVAIKNANMSCWNFFIQHGRNEMDKIFGSLTKKLSKIIDFTLIPITVMVHMKANISCWKWICMQPVAVKLPNLSPIIIRVWKKAA